MKECLGPRRNSVAHATLSVVGIQLDLIGIGARARTLVERVPECARDQGSETCNKVQVRGRRRKEKRERWATVRNRCD